MRSKLAATCLSLVSVVLLAADAPVSPRRQAQEALKPFGAFVGEWKGTGQVRPGSTKGAWIETDQWAWKLSNESAALELKVGKGKYLQSAVLTPGRSAGTFVLDAVLADGAKRKFSGSSNAKKALVLSADPKGAEGLQRLTLTPLHDTRLLVLFEGKNEEGEGFHRLAEVGLTRQGVAFAVGESGPVCIVTEGRGTTQVSYKGKTYWVCCSGCKDLFNENPEAILAEAAEKVRAKAKEKN